MTMEPAPRAESFCIPKHEVAARVTLPGQEPASVRIFLGVSAAGHSGLERPADVFNGPNGFVPAKDEEGAVVFLQRDAVMIVSFDQSEDLHEERIEDLLGEQVSRATIDVVLEDGGTLRGTVTYILPEANRRLQDFLNTADRFFELRSGGTIHLINKRRVARVGLAREQVE